MTQAIKGNAATLQSLGDLWQHRPAIDPPVVVQVPKPTGTITQDTANITDAIAGLPAAGGALRLSPGTYNVNGLVVRDRKNFVIQGNGATLMLAAASAANPTANTADVLTIADCTDFAVTGLVIDANRQQYPNSSIAAGVNGPVDQFLTANAATGQPTLTIQDGSKFFPGQMIWVCGGLTANGGTEIDYVDQHKTIASVSGNTITLTTNLTHTYTAAVDNGGAYITTYQTGLATVAGRSMSDEDQQCGIHLIGCSRFTIANNVVRNLWESPIRCGTFNQANSACTDGAILGNVLRTGYDQGVSIWRSTNITVVGNSMRDTGWAGVAFTYSWNCTAVGNTIADISYRLPGDTKSGNGIIFEGGAGHTVDGNMITRSYSKGILLSTTPINSTVNTTLTAATPIGTTGSIAVASSANFNVGGTYAIYDGARSEHVTVTAIIDGTHISIGTAKLKDWHPNGAGVGHSFPMDITITGNTIDTVVNGVGIQFDPCARITITGNVITGALQQALNLHSPAGNLGSPAMGASAVTITGNVITGNFTQGGGEQILAENISGLTITGNRITGGYPASGTKDVHLKTVTDSLITGNQITDSGNSAIYVENTCKRLTIAHNHIARCSNEGILCTSGDGLIITGNQVSSNNNTGIDVRALTHSVIRDNVVISNKNTGIKLQDNGTGCTWCRVDGNVVREDGSGSWQGAAFTQGASIVETGTSNNNVIANNTVSIAATKVGAATTITGELVH